MRQQEGDEASDISDDSTGDAEEHLVTVPVKGLIGKSIGTTPWSSLSGASGLLYSIQRGGTGVDWLTWGHWWADALAVLLFSAAASGFLLCVLGLAGPFGWHRNLRAPPIGIGPVMWGSCNALLPMHMLLHGNAQCRLLHASPSHGKG